MKSIPSLGHQIIIGLGGNGFRADCTCGWHSHTSWVRDEVARARDDHKRRTRLQEVHELLPSVRCRRLHDVSVMKKAAQ